MNTDYKLIYRRLFLFVAAIAGLYFLIRVRLIFIPFIFSFFLAYLLNSPVKFFHRRGIPKGPAILLVYAVVFGISASIVVFGFPSITEEFNRLGLAIPKLAREIQAFINYLEASYSRFALPIEIRNVIDERIAHYEGLLIEVVRDSTTFLISVFSYLLGLVIAPVFAFYLLKDIEHIKGSFVQTIPRKYRSDILAIGRDLDEIISGFLKGHLLISVIVGVMTGLGMYLIGHEFSFIIGLIAGVAELVPYLGPIITAVPAITLGLLTSQKTALYAVIIILVVQQIENAVLSPKILGRSMGLHPLMVIFSLLAGGELFGFLGVIVAVPTTAAIKIILRYIYLKLVDDKQ